METTDFLKYISLSIWPIIVIWVWYLIIKISKQKPKDDEKQNS